MTERKDAARSRAQVLEAISTADVGTAQGIAAKCPEISVRRVLDWLARMTGEGVIFRSGMRGQARYFLTRELADAWDADPYNSSAASKERRVQQSRAYSRKRYYEERGIPEPTKGEVKKKALQSSELRQCLPASPKPQKKPATGWKSLVAVNPKNVKPISCPSGKDTRYTPDKDFQRVWKKMGIGKYLPFDRAGAPI